MKLSSEILAIINIFPRKIWLLVTSFFFMATLFMLQERVVSNSMIDFVLGHFSSSFCFSSISFMPFFWIFSVSTFSLKKRLFLFSFVSLRIFFSFQSIHHSDSNSLFCADILLFASQGFQRRQNQKYASRKYSDSV